MKTEILENGMIRVSIPVTIKMQSGRKRITAPSVSALGSLCDSPVLMNLARGFHWQELIDDGTYRSIRELAAAIGIDPGVVAKAIRLTLLSPKIIHKLILGDINLSMMTLRRNFPMVWSQQEKMFIK